MAELPSTFSSKMNDVEIANEAPVTEDVMRKAGSFLNFLYDRQGVTYEEFTANGTFNVPANVSHCWVLAAGGGGGGAGFDSAGGFDHGGGGCGAVPTLLWTPVIPSSSIAVTIGAGGAGSAGGNGAAGGNTTFGSLLNFRGAPGGISMQINDRLHENNSTIFTGNSHTFFVPQYSSLPHGLVYTIGGLHSAGQNSPWADGGAAGPLSLGRQAGGGGAGFGAGTAGVNSGPSANAAANSSAGAGGQGTQISPTGSGGSGRLYVIYANA